MDWLNIFMTAVAFGTSTFFFFLVGFKLGCVHMQNLARQGKDITKRIIPIW
jgi:hypothetical protein